MGNLPRLMIIFKRQSLVLYLHEPGDEIWVSGGLILDGLIPVTIEDSVDVASIELSLSLKRTTYLSTKLNPCSNGINARAEFNKCVQDELCSKVTKQLNCSIIGYSLILGPNCKMPECQNPQTANFTYNHLFEEVNIKQLVEIRKECMRPCLKIGYDWNLRKFHKNSISNGTNGITESFMISNLILDIFYSTDLIEERTETLIYTETTFWSSVGGNLGLFLGFSCLSVALALLKIADKNVRKFLKAICGET
jgi:hypothetical protein